MNPGDLLVTIQADARALRAALADLDRKVGGEMPDEGLYLSDRMTVFAIRNLDGKPDMTLSRSASKDKPAGPVVFEDRWSAEEKARALGGGALVKTTTLGRMIGLALRNRQALYIVLKDGKRYVADLTVKRGLRPWVRDEQQSD